MFVRLYLLEYVDDALLSNSRVPSRNYIASVSEKRRDSLREMRSSPEMAVEIRENRVDELLKLRGKDLIRAFITTPIEFREEEQWTVVVSRKSLSPTGVEYVWCDKFQSYRPFSIKESKRTESKLRERTRPQKKKNSYSMIRVDEGYFD